MADMEHTAPVLDAEEQRRAAADADAAAHIDAIKAKLDAAKDPDVVRSLMGSLRGVQLPAGTVMAGELAAAMQLAEKRLMEEIVDEQQALQDGMGGAGFAPRSPMERAVFNFMSQQEQEYFQSFDPNKQYSVALLDENGEVVRDANGNPVTREVSGQQLRDDIVNITRESLPPQQQKQIEEEVRREETGQQQGEQAPKPRSQELEELEHSLQNVEGRKAQEVEEARREGRITEDEAREQHAHNRERFREARERVREAREARREEERHRHNAREGNDAQRPMAEIMEGETRREAEGKEAQMRESLQEVRETISETPEQRRERIRAQRREALEEYQAHQEGRAAARGEERATPPEQDKQPERMEVASVDKDQQQFVPTQVAAERPARSNERGVA